MERDKLQEEVDSLVHDLFDGYLSNHQDVSARDVPARNDGKVIRDPIHGFLHLRPWEVEVFDSPLVQRLRYIHQNALAYFVYPSANHSRLEHSLGMAKVVQDVARAFREADDTSDLFDDTIIGELRLAALLHDVGHGVFSHLSETIIESRWHASLALIKTLPLFRAKSAGEILSYMMVTSKKFSEFLSDVIARHNRPYNVKRIAGYIVGSTDNPALELYKADLITGPIDADKLDYLPRDSYFTGIRTEVDTQHIIQSLQVWPKSTGIGRTLVVGLSGATSVEQMHFAKFSLFPAMYQHQKVRALECMFRGLLEKIWAAGSGISHSKLKFTKITDFLRLSDGEFLTLAASEPLLERKVQLLQNRNLLRRALHISASVIEAPLEDTDYSDLVKLGSREPEAQAEITKIRGEILENVFR